MSILERLIYKCTSGRFLIGTILTAVYAYAAVTGKLTDALNAAEMLVIAFYFNKKDAPSTDNTKQESDNK